MRTREGRPLTRRRIALGLIATGAVSVGIGAIVAVTSAASEIFGTAPTESLPVHDVDLTDAWTESPA